MRLIDMSNLTTVLALVPLFAASLVQEGAASHQHASPYAHQGDSGIAALSPQELAELEAGAGMGLARAAELNHFPGPLHVLELAPDLDLTPAQLEEVTAVRAAMLEAAIALGAQIIEQERALDRRFEHAHIDDGLLEAATATIAALQGRLRYVHLRAHLQTRDLLDAQQIDAYDRLRGYVDGE